MISKLTSEEIHELVKATIHKIETYPKEYGKTLDNYFHVLFSDMVRQYVEGREINRKSKVIMEARKNGEK